MSSPSSLSRACSSRRRRFRRPRGTSTAKPRLRAVARPLSRSRPFSSASRAPARATPRRWPPASTAKRSISASSRSSFEALEGRTRPRSSTPTPFPVSCSSRRRRPSRSSASTVGTETRHSGSRRSTRPFVRASSSVSRARAPATTSRAWGGSSTVESCSSSAAPSRTIPSRSISPTASRRCWTACSKATRAGPAARVRLRLARLSRTHRARREQHRRRREAVGPRPQACGSRSSARTRARHPRATQPRRPTARGSRRGTRSRAD